MNNQKYNGFTNYETCLCNECFNGFQFIDMIDMFDNCEDNCDVLDIIAQYIKERVEEYVECSLSPGDQHGFINDMLNAEISEIDWNAIAEQYVDDVVDELKLIKNDQKEEIMKLV